jgi:hypothetical protein
VTPMLVTKSGRERRRRCDWDGRGGAVYELENEENVLEEIDVNYILSLLMSKLHDPYALHVGD